MTNSEGKVIGEYDEVSNSVKGDKVSSFADLMSSEDAATYNKWMDLRAAGYDILVDDYIKICKESIQNPSSDTMTLGKYFPSIKQDGSSDWSIPANHSYTVMAGDTTYFSLGNERDVIKETYSITDKEMFELFNVPALDDAVKSGKEIRFSQDPRAYGGGALKDEWEYFKVKCNYADLIKEGDYWYAVK